MKKEQVFSGNIADVMRREIYPGSVSIRDGKIHKIVRGKNTSGHYIVPGLIDAHIHIESSMLVPSEFARVAVTHGTVASVSDPHEITNVLGTEGIKYMISNGKKVPFKFYFGASSCVPATGFETSGARLGADAIEELLQQNDIKYLSEMMNYPGVLHKDPEVMTKLDMAKKYARPVDGHAPGLKGKEAKAYAEAGISTDHECYQLDEARDKIRYGMKILIREGSAAKNFDELIPLLAEYPGQVMFCSDDRHPDDLVRNHINDHIKRALAKGYDPMDVLRAATCNPVMHYGLDCGLLREGDPADFIIADNLEEFNILETYINGEPVARNGKSLIPQQEVTAVNNFSATRLSPKDLIIPPESDTIRVIHALDGQLITQSFLAPATIQNQSVVSNPETDILKMVVLNRYTPSPPALAFVKGFGLKQGAIASTVAHDSHNIIAVGTTDGEIVSAINLLIENQGGIATVDRSSKTVLPLPVAGLMTTMDGWRTAEKYAQLDKQAKEMGSTLHAPFMTLSFMALLVIPQLKLSDKGLFDGKTFAFTDLFVI